MRKSTIASITLVGAVALTLFAAAPANAAVTDPTNTVTVTVIGGGVLITSVSGGTALPTILPDADGGATTGMTSLVTVVDSRAVKGNWTVGAAASAFTDSLGNTDNTGSMLGAKVNYSGSTPVNTGTSNAAGQAAQNLSTTSSPVVIASSTSGFNTSVWTASISTTVPSAALLGVYTSTITHSVL